MLPQDILNAYSAEVLGFGFKSADSPAQPPPAPTAADLERLVARSVAAFERSGRRHLLLLGLGSGALAAALAAALPAGTLLVCEQDLALVRELRAAGRMPWWRPTEPQGPAGLAADASAWALFFLLDRAGIAAQDALVLPNPELAPQAKAAHRQLELLLLRSRPLSMSAGPPQSLEWPRLSAAAILAPTEPDLPGFFAQFPDWLSELVLVWDAESLPAIAVPERFPVRQSARPLNADFAAQRGAMLAACTGDWVLYLDADERLAPEAFAAVPALCAAPPGLVGGLVGGPAGGPAGVNAWHFPRLTPYPDAEHALVGFGLWPDLQLRLFRNAPGLSFVNPVHERLTGVKGGQGLALDLEIEHLNRLGRGPQDIRQKLAGFDAAGAGQLRHTLSAEYPSLPRALVAARQPDSPSGPLRCLLLPPETA